MMVLVGAAGRPPPGGTGMHAAVGGPSLEERELAVAKAVAYRRATLHAQATERLLPVPPIAERVRGRALPAREGRDGWWLVGEVIDEIEACEFTVWLRQEARRIGLARREAPTSVGPSLSAC